MSEAKFTPGPWLWDLKVGRPSSYNHVRLATPKLGRMTIIDAVRMGMGSAQLRFQVAGIMTPAMELAKDADHNGYARLDHPDAHLIAAAPDLYEALERVVASANPNPMEHPHMAIAWEAAKQALEKARGER